MSRVQRNVAANFGGRLWLALVGLVFIPVYIKYLGMESYGLIGFMVTLQTLANVLDLGLGATVRRELARFSAEPQRQPDTADLVRTLEFGYWLFAAVVALSVWASAPWIARHWVNPETLGPTQVERAVSMMALAVAAQLPLSFYTGGLMGLQLQPLANAVSAGMATVRSVGAVAVLVFVSPTIVAFLAWQAITSLLHAAVAATYLWRSLPGGALAAHVRPATVRRVGRFAAGVSAISLITLPLTQLDKVILSKLLPLDVFGYYVLAGVVATTLYSVISPIFDALFPEFARLASTGDEETLASVYQRGAQLVSVLMLPVAVTLVFFSYDLLILWTRDSLTAQQTSPLVSILAVGTALNGLMYLPYALQLAHGWTRLTFYSNCIGVIALVPMIVLLTLRFGPTGAATVWVLLNAGYVTIVVPLMHRRLLRTEQRRWYLRSVATPLGAALIVVGAGRYAMVGDASDLSRVLWIGATLVCAWTAAALVTQSTRLWLRRQLLFSQGLIRP